MTSNQVEASAAFSRIVQQYRLPDLLHNSANSETDMLHGDGLSVPITVCHSSAAQAWVMSPMSLYVDYAQEESRRNLPRFAAAPVNGMLGGLKIPLNGCDFSQAVMLNNWLVSTNLYPVLQREAVTQIMAQAVQRYPRHALWWRSLNEHHHRDWLTFLQTQGCILIPSRRIYLLDNPQQAKQQYKNWHQDSRVLHKQSLHVMDNADFGSDADYRQALHLYRLLYLEKYSRLNPDYSLTWLKHMHGQGLLYLQGVCDESGAMRAVAGSLMNDTHLVTPFLGFDTAQPQKRGLYRIASLLATDLAIAHNKHLNRSAGAGHFKRQRGAKPYIEYSAVYLKHLPRKQRLAIAQVAWLSRYIGKPLLEYCDL